MKGLKSIIVLSTLIFAGTSLLAQSARNAQAMQEAKAAMDEFFKEIGVTDEQMAQIETLRAEMQKEMEALRSEGQGPDTRQKMGEIRDDHDAEMAKVLTEEQYEKYKAKQKELRAQGQKRRTRAQKPN